MIKSEAITIGMICDGDHTAFRDGVTVEDMFMLAMLAWDKEDTEGLQP